MNLLSGYRNFLSFGVRLCGAIGPEPAGVGLGTASPPEAARTPTILNAGDDSLS